MTVNRAQHTYTAFKGKLSDTNGLSLGHKGAKVSSMQEMLKAAGFDPGPIDGKFGPLTLKALKAYQAAVGDKVDGKLELTDFKRLKGNYEKITDSGFETPRGGFNRTGQYTGQTDNITVQTSGAQGKGTAAEMLKKALEQKGDRYVFGHEVKLNDANPSTFDCSELVQWAVHQAGGSIPDGSQNQRRAVDPKLSVREAAHIPGALLFNGHHVAISVGDGVHTIEAMGSKHGVKIGTIANRFEDAGLVKGLKY